MSEDFWVLILVYVIGLVLYFVELFLPSGGTLAAAATLTVAFALWRLFPEHPYIASSCILVTIAYLVILIYWGVRRLNSVTSLAGGTAAGADVVEAGTLVGVEGTAVTALRPSGVAIIHGKRFDVVSRSGEFIEAGSRVQVMAADGNRIVVRPLV
ncbi:MAG: hypothetical protein L0Z55_03725 [Planctomycetes bacterium]|nr:hypothetical protein [Planctomycetota bacterium]